MPRTLLSTLLALAAACAPHPTATSSAPAAPAPAASPPATPAATRITIERDRMIVVRGAEPRELADVDDLPDLMALDQLLGTPGPGNALTVDLADDAIYADLRAVLKVATLHGLELTVGMVAVAASEELPASDIPMFAVSDAEVAVGTYQSSTPDPLVFSVPPSTDNAVSLAAATVAGLRPVPTVVLLVIEPSTSGAVVNRLMRALHTFGIERAVFGARRG